MRIMMKKQGTGAPVQATGFVAITGTVEVGHVLTADTSNIYDPNTIVYFSYKWLRDGIQISGEVSSTYTVSTDDMGADISVEVQAVDSLSDVITFTSVSVGPVPFIAPSGMAFSKTIENTFRFVLRGSSVDSQGNIYVTGNYDRDSNGSGNDLLLFKYDQYLNLIWKKHYYGQSTHWFEGHDVAVDSNDNVYVVGEYNSNVVNNNAGLVVKFDTNGNKLLAKYFNNTEHSDSFSTVEIYNDQLYITGILPGLSSSSADMGVVVLNADLSYVYGWRGGHSTYQDIGWKTLKGSSGNLYTAGVTVTGIGNNDLWICKKTDSNNSAFTWQKSFGRSNNEDFDQWEGIGFTIDESENLYVAGKSNDHERVLLSSFDSNGNLRWHRDIVLSGYNLNVVKLEYDSVGSLPGLYVVTSGGGAGSEQTFITKLNSNGGLIYRGALDSNGAGSDFIPVRTSLDSFNNLIITGHIEAAENGAYVARLPGDGTGVTVISGLSYTSSGVPNVQTVSGINVNTTSYTPSVNTNFAIGDVSSFFVGDATSVTETKVI